MSNKVVLMLRASGLSFAALVVRVGIVFLLTPLILHRLGMHWYGFWTVIVATIGHFSLADAGLGTATKQYMTLAIERKEYDEASRVLSTSLVLYGAVGIVLLAAGLIIAACGGLFFREAAEASVFRAAFVIYSADMALGLASSALSGALYANLRGDILAIMEIVSQLVRACLTVAVLALGMSVIGLSLAQLVTSALLWPIQFLILKSICPWLKIRLRSFDRGLTKRMYGYGLWSFITVITRVVRSRIDSLILAWLSGLQSVTIYSFASTITEYYTDVTSRAVFQLSTIFAQYYAKADWENLREKFLISSRLSALAVVLFGGGVLVFGQQFLTLWLGSELSKSFAPLVLLGSSITLSLMFLPGWELLLATHQQKNFALLSVVELATKVALCIVFVHRFGLIGMALATITPQTAFALGYMSWAPCRLIGISPLDYWRELARVAVPGALVQLALYALIRPLTFDNLFQLFGFGAAVYIPLGAILALVVLRPVERKLLLNGAGKLLPAK